MYMKTTHEVKIIAVPTYLPTQSDPAKRHYVWAYTIQITNMGEKTVQLLDRHWIITNAIGQVQDVEGEGVIGEQPIIKPGDQYQYSSGSALTTPSGIMVGSYGMVDIDTGDRFDVDIPAFSLDSPFEQMHPN